MTLAPLFALTDGARWAPGIGDPTIIGWITVAAYFLVAIVCARLAFSQRAESSPSDRRFWAAVACLLFFLGINKQLDLQTWLTITAKQAAISQGWYENRRVVQAAFVAAIALIGMAAVYFVVTRFRKHSEHRWVIVGASLLVTFVVVRAASFHYVDQLLGMSFAGLKINAQLELGAIAFLLIAALKTPTLVNDAGATRAVS